jgi:hypothetical protein
MSKEKYSKPLNIASLGLSVMSVLRWKMRDMMIMSISAMPTWDFKN